MNPQKKRRLFLIGGIALAVLAAAVVLIFVLGGIRGGGDDDGAYRTHYTAARAAYLAGEYDEALAELAAALKIEETTEALKLQVEILEFQRQLQANRDNSGGGESDDGGITVAGQRFAADAVTAVLSGKDLGNEDFAALCALTNLENLSVANNNISDLRPIAALTKLRTLYLDGNPVTDLTPLYGMKNLRTLSVAGIGIGAEARAALAEALPGCTILPPEEEKAPEKITLGGMTFTTEVTELNLSSRGITDISALADCKDLVRLDLRDNNITDLTPLVELQKLEWLCLWNNDVKDVTPLMGLANLQYLDLDGNEIRDVAALGYLAGLTDLWLNGNPLQNLTPLAKLTGLERLGLKNTGLTDTQLPVLLNLENLKELSLDENQALSDEILRSLREALPNCRITPEPAPETPPPPEETWEPGETQEPGETEIPVEPWEPVGEETPGTE